MRGAHVGNRDLQRGIDVLRERVGNRAEVVDAMVLDQDTEDVDRQAGRDADALRDLFRDLELHVILDAGICVQVLQLDRLPALSVELFELEADIVRRRGRAGDVHDGAGVRAGEATNHWTPSVRMQNAKCRMQN